jgi:transcriptional regulator with XRE-family HTH domain
MTECAVRGFQRSSNKEETMISAVKGMSQEELAFVATVDRSYISGMEREAFNPTVDMLERLAKALAVDVAEFLSIPKGAAAKPKPLRPGRRPKAYPLLICRFSLAALVLTSSVYRELCGSRIQ